MNNKTRLIDSKRSIGASTIDDFQAMTRILKTHTYAGIMNSYDITSIIAVNTTKHCMNKGCSNSANFAVSQRFTSGKYFTYYLCKDCLKMAYMMYVNEIIEKIDDAVNSVQNRNIKNGPIEVER